jgi:hypothetical protein
MLSTEIHILFPADPGVLAPGDVVEITIDGIGTWRKPLERRPGGRQSVRRYGPAPASLGRSGTLA